MERRTTCLFSSAGRSETESGHAIRSSRCEATVHESVALIQSSRLQQGRCHHAIASDDGREEGSTRAEPSPTDLTRIFGFGQLTAICRIVMAHEQSNYRSSAPSKRTCYRRHDPEAWKADKEAGKERRRETNRDCRAKPRPTHTNGEGQRAVAGGEGGRGPVKMKQAWRNASEIALGGRIRR